MVRGDYLRDTIVPLMAARLRPVDAYAETRFTSMCRDYGIVIPSSESVAAPAGPGSI
jgi:hypothetical protein